MSGIEIAGLVLGSLPLIISAMEHYKSNVDRATAFFKWKGELDKTMRELWIQHSYYEMTLRNLLTGLVSSFELEELMSHPQNPLWKSADLDSGLRAKLGAAYRVYAYTVQEMSTHMETLASHLDIDRTTAPTANDLEAILLANRPTYQSHQQGVSRFEFRRAIKLTMKRSKIKDLLKEVKECIDRLDSFIEKADHVEQTSRPAPTRRKSALSVPLHQIHSHAIHLHQALSNSWLCNAHLSHNVYLLLEHRMALNETRTRRSAKSQHRDWDESTASDFTLSFKSPDYSGPAFGWNVAEVRVIEEQDTEPVAKRVKFGIAPRPSRSKWGLEVVRDLCSAFKQGLQSRLGFCLDLATSGSQAVLRRTHYPRSQLTPSNNLVTLADVLFSKHCGNSMDWDPLTEEDRYVLAITVAASFLQLYKTPWINDRWSERDILFFYHEQVDDTSDPTGSNNNLPFPIPQPRHHPRRMIDIHHPFVAKAYYHTQTSPPIQPFYATHPHASPGQHGTSTVYTTKADELAHDDSINLLALAKMLLEIRSSRRIEELRTWDDLGPNAIPNEATDLQTLKRWIAREKGNLSFAFRGAIGYCMKCFADPDTDLEDLEFRQGVIDSVVVPLLEELRYLQEGW